MAESSYPSNQEGKGRAASFNEKLGEFKKFASTSFTRARQYTIEKIGRADSVTAYDSEYETMSEQLDAIKSSTERIISFVQAMVQPNPGVRLEEMMYSRLDRPKPYRSATEELLGAEMSKAGIAFGTDTQYGQYLKQCGVAEVKMGQTLQQHHDRVQKEFVTPLRAFLEVDVKNAMRERKIVNVKRLDLDAAKSRTKKLSEGEKLQQAETELREAQAEFDLQLRKVREAMRKIVQTHSYHLGYLKAFMAAQKDYHKECLSHLQDIDTEGVPPPRPLPPHQQGKGSAGGEEGEDEVENEGKTRFVVNGIEFDREDSRKAKVLYDYEAVDESELTLYCDQVITVTPLPSDDEYLMAEFEGNYGKIPSTYVELL